MIDLHLPEALLTRKILLKNDSKLSEANSTALSTALCPLHSEPLEPLLTPNHKTETPEVSEMLV